MVTSDPARQAQVAREHPDARVLASAEELSELADSDLVVVAAPNEAHAPLALEAIDHQLAVVVDKPLAVTAAEAEAVVLRAEQAGVLLTAFQTALETTQLRHTDINTTRVGLLGARASRRRRLAKHRPRWVAV